jgi:Spy/CpxP family protein refolding chaperone
MKKLLMLCLMASSLFFAGCATSNTANTSNDDDAYRNEETVANSKLNNRRLEKNMDRFAKELDLSKRQQKQLKKIDRRYARLERKLSRNDDSKRSDRKRLAEEKRQEIIEVLTPEQQQTLQSLAKKGRFSLDQIFGK